MSYFYFEFSILSSRAQLRSTFVYKIIIFVFKTLRTSFTNISIKIDSLYKQRASLFLKITILNLTTNTNSKHFSIILFKIFCTKGNFNSTGGPLRLVEIECTYKKNRTVMFRRFS